MKRIFAVLVAAVFFLGSTFCFASPEMLLSDKSLYLSVEKHNMEKLLNQFEKFGELDFVKFCESETPLKLEMNFKVDTSEDEFIKRDIKILDEVNVAEKYENLELQVYNNDEYIATLDIIADGTKLAFRIPELYEKYISVDLGNMTELYKKFGMPEEELKAIELSYKMAEDLEKLITLSEEQEKDLKDCITRCGMLLNNLIKDEYFIRDDNAVVSYDSQMIPCRSISMEIPQRDLVQIVKALWNEIKSDEDVMKIFENMLNGYYEIYGELLVTTQESYNDILVTEPEMYDYNEMIAKPVEQTPTLPTFQELLASIDEVFVALEQAYGPEYDEGRIISKIYFTEDYNIIKRDFGIRNISVDYESMLSLYTLEDYYAVEGKDFLFEDKILVSGNTTTHSFKYEYLTYDYDFDEYYNFITTERTETTNFVVKVEKLSEQSYRFSMEPDEFNRLELDVSTNTLDSDSAVLNFGMRVISKMEPSLQSLQKDMELSFMMTTKVTKNYKLIKEDFSNNEININTMSLEALEQEWKNNEELITERAENLVNALFPEMISMQARMQERADKATAAQIGKAVRVWYTEYSYDMDMQNRVGDKKLSEQWIEYSELGDIDNYIWTGQESDVGKYYVALQNAGTLSERLVVGVSNCGGLDLPSPNDAILEGNIYYIEP